MPFSVIAVLLLVLSSASIALVYGLDTRKEGTPIPEKTLEQMRACIDDGLQDVVRIAYSSAIGSIQATKELNESAVQQRFTATLNATLSATYPAWTGDIQTRVEHDLRLQFLRASLRESYALYGQDLASWEGASVPAYFVLIGNCTINVTCPQGQLSKTAELDQDIYVPLPLLMYRLDRLARASVPRGELESVVRYELSALAQERVLRGYGMEAKTGIRSTEAIITNEDVVRAVNLALILEEINCFQDIGSSSGADLEGVLPTLSDIDGPVDPADLFLRSYDEGGIDLAPIVAQTINARADAIVLKWLDYFKIIDLINVPEEIYEFEKQGLTDVLDDLTGGDTDRMNMQEYISKALSDVGIQEYDYRWFCYGGPDVVVDLPAYKICFLDDQGNKVYRYFQGKYQLDLPAVDVFSSPAWGDLYRRYESETHLVAETMKRFVASVAAGVASYCSLPIIELSLDPRDDKTYLQELDEQLEVAFRDGSSWLKPALDRANEVSRARDGLAQAVMDFMDQRWTELLQMNRSVQQGAEQLSWTLAHQMNGTAHFSTSTIAEAQHIIYMELLGDYWGAREAILSAVRDKAAPIHERLDRGLSQKVGEGNVITDLMSFGISCLPGLEWLTADAVLDTIEGLRGGLVAAGGEVLVPLSHEGLILTLADGQQRVETIETNSTVLKLSDDGRAGSLDVQVKEPWAFDRANTSYPNRHVTNLLDMTTTPYLTEWGIEYHGIVEISLRSSSGSDKRIDTPCSSRLAIDASFNIITFSGWGLEGVSYSATATLAGDVQKLLVKVWDFLVSAVQAVGGLVGKAFTFFCQLADQLLSYATKPLEVLNQLLLSSLEALGGTMDGFLGSIIEATSEATVWALNGTRIDLSILGLGLVVVIGPSDSALVGAEDRIRADLSLSCYGATITSSVRALRLPNGENTLAGTVTMGGGDWSVDLTLDPRTKVYQHQIEVRGYLGGHVLEIVAPEYERAQKASFALSGIPVISQALKNIPSPIPGTKFYIDAGIELRFNVLDRRNVLINEIELNPRGKDASREWVELFNPSDLAVDLTGWSLGTARGQTHTELLSGTIPAHGYFVHHFSGQALDNGEVKGFPLLESVALIDRKGDRVDSAPWLKDLGDDDRTWQRSFDGSSHWELREGSEGASNGFVLLSEANMDGLVAVLGDCFKEAFDELVGSGLDMGTLEEVIRNALQRFEDRMLDSIERTVSSLKFFLKLGLDDVSGSVGAGMNVALVYDGKAVRECVRWLMDAIGELLRDPLNPMAAATRAPVPVQTLADHVYVQLGVYVSAGAPDLIKDYVGVKVSAVAVIKVSLRTMGLFEDNGRWELNFGLVVTGLQGVKIKSPGGASTEACYDVWLLRGSLRPA